MLPSPPPPPLGENSGYVLAEQAAAVAMVSVARATSKATARGITGVAFAWEATNAPGAKAPRKGAVDDEVDERSNRKHYQMQCVQNRQAD